MTDVLPELEPLKAPATLAVEQLYSRCDDGELPFASTNDLEPLDQHLGQDRAVDALRFGLDIAHEGYNVFVLGNTGVGKRQLLENLLQEDGFEPREDVSDWCYVNNFDSPDKPIALRLPQGMGSRLRGDMLHAVEELLAIMPATFQSDEYQSRVQELGEQFQEREKEAFQSLAERAAQKNIAMIQTPSGYTLAPMKDGEIVSPQDFEALPEEARESTLKDIEAFKEELKVIVRQLPGWKKEGREAFRELNQEYSQLAIDPVFADLKQAYADYPDILSYLDAVHTNVMEEA